MNKREFVRTAGGAGLSLLFGDRLWAKYATMPVERLAREEDFWEALRGKYRLTPDYINLENGYYSMQSQPVLEAFIDKVREVNYDNTHYMRTTQVPDKLAVRAKLALLAGCAPEELIITRNTTESLDTVIAGFDWKAGDEAVMADQDYGAMLDMFALQAKRHGMVAKRVSLPMDPQSDDEIVQLYASAITPRTRLLMICHMVNITGQILPVKKVCAMAHARGVDVMVDGAHAFAQLDYRIPDLDSDYYGASLHKWLGAPLGTGLLFGLFPALHSTRPDLVSTLKGQAGQPSGARAAARFRSCRSPAFPKAADSAAFRSAVCGCVATSRRSRIATTPKSTARRRSGRRRCRFPT